MAEESIRALRVALPQIARDPRDLAARSEGLYGAWLAGAVLGNVGMALHHKLCHVLGGAYGLPHAQTHSAVLPHAAAYNEPAAPAAMAAIARGLGAERAPAGLYDLAHALGAPISLAELGMRASDLDAAAELASKDPYANPRPLERAALRELLQNAFDGRRPGV